MSARDYTSRRYSILTAFANKINESLNGSGPYRTNLYNNAHPKMVFWDEQVQHPAVYMALGQETRGYQAGGYKDRYLNVTVRCYVKDEDPQNALELLLEDLETVIEENGRLAYQDSSGVTQTTHDILIASIDTDEGALAPLGVGEILLQVQY